MPTYFITFTTYGTWVHGDERGSVDRRQNGFGEPLVESEYALRMYRSTLMTEPPFTMDAECREIVLAAIRQHAEFRGWNLVAAHVRSSHVHLVVAANVEPETVMTQFKARASRALNAGVARKRWTRHGSTRHLSSEESIRRAVHYTVAEQGQAMALYVCEEFQECGL